MKLFFLLYIVSVPYMLIGQQKQEFETWELSCDTLMSQRQMNLCSAKSYQIADSILTALYNEISNQLESRLAVEKEYIDLSSDSIQDTHIELINNQLKILEQSQQSFYKLLNSTIEIMDLQYQHASMRPLVVNSYALKMTGSQIEILRMMIDEIYR